MVGFASPMRLYQTSPPSSPCQRPHGSRRRRLTTAYRLLFKVITTGAGPRCLWISRRHQSKCLRLPAGRRCQCPDLHQTNQTKQTLYGKQLPRELLFQLGSLLLRPHRCEISAYLYIYSIFFPFLFSPAKWLFCYSLTASTSACPLERFLPVASRFVIVLIGNVSILYLAWRIIPARLV